MPPVPDIVIEVIWTSGGIRLRFLCLFDDRRDHRSRLWAGPGHLALHTPIPALTAVEHVRARAAVERVVAGAAAEHVAAGTGADAVVAAQAVDAVVARQGHDDIVSGGAP